MKIYYNMNDVSNRIMRDSDKALIPQVPENRDYQQYLKDVDEGAVIIDFDWAAETVRLDKAKQDNDEKKILEIMIQEELREVAITNLKAKGKLDANGKVK